MTSLHLSASVDKPSFTVWVLNKCQDTVLVSRPVLRGTKADWQKKVINPFGEGTEEDDYPPV